MKPWENWIHVTGSTYGTWLRGDPRGWRSRHHREHVEGDYRSPPPKGAYDDLHAYSKYLMKRAGVRLDWDSRMLACRVMVEALRFHHVDVADFCVGAIHWHGLCRFYPIAPEVWRAIRLEDRSQNRDPRHLVGIARKRAARAMSEAGLVPEGGVFARGCGRKFIADERHFKIVRDSHVPNHAQQGAAVWSVLFRGS